MDTNGVELLESAIRDATQAVDDPEPVEGGFSVGWFVKTDMGEWGFSVVWSAARCEV